MHGVFSKPSRLSRQPQQPLTETPLPAVASKTTLASRARASISPSTSIPRLNKSTTPSPAGSTTSLASISGGPLKLGDRVIVASQQGTKTGTLR